MSISCLASFESMSGVSIVGILFISSVNGFSELVTNGILVIDVTDSTIS